MKHGLVNIVSKIEFRPRLLDWLLSFKKRSMKLKTSKPWVRCAYSNVSKQRLYFYTFLFKLANSQLILVLVEIASRLLICARRRQSTIELPRLFAYLLDLPPMYIVIQMLVFYSVFSFARINTVVLTYSKFKFKPKKHSSL